MSDAGKAQSRMNIIFESVYSDSVTIIGYNSGKKIRIILWSNAWLNKTLLSPKNSLVGMWDTIWKPIAVCKYRDPSNSQIKFDRFEYLKTTLKSLAVICGLAEAQL